MDIEDAVMCVQEFIDTGHKSMYLMDAWIKIIKFVEEHKGENDETSSIH